MNAAHFGGSCFRRKQSLCFRVGNSSVTCRMCIVSCTSTPQSLSFKSDWGAIMRHARSPVRCLRPIGTRVALFYGRHIFSLSVFLVIKQLRPQSIQFRRVLVVIFSIFSLVTSLFTLHIFIAKLYYYCQTFISIESITHVSIFSLAWIIVLSVGKYLLTIFHSQLKQTAVVFKLTHFHLPASPYAP